MFDVGHSLVDSLGVGIGKSAHNSASEDFDYVEQHDATPILEIIRKILR